MWNKKKNVDVRSSLSLLKHVKKAVHKPTLSHCCHAMRSNVRTFSLSTKTPSPSLQALQGHLRRTFRQSWHVMPTLKVQSTRSCSFVLTYPTASLSECSKGLQSRRWRCG